MSFRFVIPCALALTSVAQAGFSSSEVASMCPAPVLDAEARNRAAYPGDEPGRAAQDYSFIAVIVSAVAVCREDEDDRLVADVTVTYAIEPGPLYRGVAENEVVAAVSGPAGEFTRGTASRNVVHEGREARAIQDVVRGVVIGDFDTVEAGVTLKVGFVGAPPAAARVD